MLLLAAPIGTGDPFARLSRPIFDGRPAPISRRSRGGGVGCPGTVFGAC